MKRWHLLHRHGARFGEEYRRYRDEVVAFLPRLRAPGRPRSA